MSLAKRPNPAQEFALLLAEQQGQLQANMAYIQMRLEPYKDTGLPAQLTKAIYELAYESHKRSDETIQAYRTARAIERSSEHACTSTLP